MLANMASSLIMHKRIHTTIAKAKALRGYIEPLLTKSKEDTTHSRRVVFSHLQNKEAVTELFRDISVKIADRPGGYTRIIKIGARLGDNAEMCMMELVDYNENLLGTKDAGKEKAAKRRRRGGAKKETDQVAKTTAKAAVAAAPLAAGTEEEVAVEGEVQDAVKDEAEVAEATEAVAEVAETEVAVETEVEITEEPSAVAEEPAAVAEEPASDETPAEEKSAPEDETEEKKDEPAK
jgi:large subunit ribosomal protein L17